MTKPIKKQLLYAVLRLRKKGVIAQIANACAAGADVKLRAHGSIEWTPACYAKEAGHEQLANWLRSRVNEIADAQGNRV